MPDSANDGAAKAPAWASSDPMKPQSMTILPACCDTAAAAAATAAQAAS
jgi:hypothetical protein